MRTKVLLHDLTILYASIRRSFIKVKSFFKPWLCRFISPLSNDLILINLFFYQRFCLTYLLARASKGHSFQRGWKTKQNVLKIFFDSCKLPWCIAIFRKAICWKMQLKLSLKAPRLTPPMQWCSKSTSCNTHNTV